MVRKYFTVATSGHVDHGKTSLLKALTGTDPDRLKEEKERQMTTDIGFCHLSFANDCHIGFIDVPGHGKFLKNMLAGVGAIDSFMLIVSCEEGVMPQTIEHMRILSLLGVRNCIIVATKSDLATKEKVDATISEAKKLCLDYAIEPFACVPVSSSSGDGLEALKSYLQDLPKHLVKRYPNELEDFRTPHAYLPIDRIFTKAGFGQIVAGTLMRGVLKDGDEIFVEPGALRARIRRLETFSQTVSEAQIGQRVALNIVFKESCQLKRGQVISARKLKDTKQIVLALTDSTFIPHDQKSLDELKKEGRGFLGHSSRFAKPLVGEVRVYQGTSECYGRLNYLERLNHVSTDEITSLEEHWLASVNLREPLVAGCGEQVVLRHADDTITGGKILATDRPRWLSYAKWLEIAPYLLKGSYEQALIFCLDFCPKHSFTRQQIEFLVPQEQIEEVWARLEKRDDCLVIGESLIKLKQYDYLRSLLLEDISKTGAKGMSYEELISLRERVAPRVVLEDILLQLSANLEIERREARLFGKGIATNEDQGLAASILLKLSTCLCLEISELAKVLSRSESEIRKELENLKAKNQATIVAYEFAASKKSIDKAHRVLASLWQGKKDISPSDFRQSLDTSRKYAMALLSYFDDNAITRRLSSGRVLLRSPEN